MKLLCVSDQIDPLVYSSNAKERFADIDVVLCAGDLPMEYVDFIVSTLNKPTYFIFGNHNLTEFRQYHPDTTSPSAVSARETIEMKHSHGAIYSGFQVLTEKLDNGGQLLIAGCSGSVRYNNGLSQYTEGQMKRRLLKMVPKLLMNRLRYGRYCDIFLTHASPRHIHDREDPCHIGFTCYRWFLKKFKPLYMIHGHIHLYDLQDIRVTPFEDTTVINAFSYYVLEIPDEKLRKPQKEHNA